MRNQTHVSDGMQVDALVVGAGFGGSYLLHKLRSVGLNVKLVEAGSRLGGVWYWSRFPGARVDVEVPFYQLSLPELWRDWLWKERYPSYEELSEYFEHVDKTLRLSEDIYFDTVVTSATYSRRTCNWNVRLGSGQTIICKYFIAATGTSHKDYVPYWEGREKFKGTVLHSSRWPEAGIDLQDKEVGIVGSGATGVQICQEAAKVASKLTVFIRTPNIALPMRQRALTYEEQEKSKQNYLDIFKRCRSSSDGLPYRRQEKRLSEVSENERESLFENLWANGGFQFLSANYGDIALDLNSNRAAYDFWVRKTKQRITNKEKRDFLVPSDPPHPLGAKRLSLEQDYYEQLDKPHVRLVNTKATPIEAYTPTGIRTADGTAYDFDVLILATGYDAVTGGLLNMGIQDKNDVGLKAKWSNGVKTYLGLTVHGCPNMFMVYGPQAPTAFSNGPMCVEAQCDWIVDAIRKMNKENIDTIEATEEAQESWTKLVHELSDMTLIPLADSWYMGANVPGKKREALMFLGGLANYEIKCREALSDWKGFDIIPQAKN